MDWSLPSLTQSWANFLAAIKGRDESNAKMDYSADSNIPDGTIRWSAANNRFEVWDATGLTWSELSSQYLINVDKIDSEHAADFASAVGGSGSRQAKDADTVDGVDLPGTIALVLTDHTKAAHDALNINANLLQGYAPSQFLRSDTSDTMSGNLTLTGDLRSAAGSASSPAHSFSSDPNSGLYSGGNGDVRIAIDGSLALQITGSVLRYFGNDILHEGNFTAVFSDEYESGEIALTTASTTLTHGLGGMPKLYQLALRCKTAEGGWGVGDEVIPATASLLIGGISSTQLRVIVDSSPTILMQSTSGSAFTITTSRWRVVARAWR